MRPSSATVLLLLVVTGLWRWGEVVTHADVLPDERSYVAASRHLAEGGSAYEEPTYVYPSLLARAVRRTSSLVGEIQTLQILRGLSLGGTVLLVTLALALVEWPWPLRALAGMAYVTCAPAVRIATDLGNIAGLSGSLALVALVCWQRRPVLSGAALGMGLALKPIAPLAPLALAFHRSSAPIRQQWLAAGSCAAVGALTLLPDIHRVSEAFANSARPGSVYNFSLHRILEGLGIPIPAAAVFVLTAASLVLFLRSRELDRQALLIVAIGFSIASLPILWAHSLLLLLPAQLLAVDRAVRTLIIGRLAETDRQRFLAMLALAAVVASLLPHAVGTVDGLPGWSVPIILAYPLVAALLVTWYAIGPRHT